MKTKPPALRRMASQSDAGKSAVPLDLILVAYLVDYPRFSHVFEHIFCQKYKKQAAEHSKNDVLPLILEQDTGLEPAAYCLGSSRSTG